MTGETIDSYHVGFMIARRVNAAGRMSTPDIAMRLLLATEESDAGEARDLASQLNDENEKRQREERGIVAEARHLVENDPDIGARSVLVVSGAGWHRGVIGIVASKLRGRLSQAFDRHIDRWGRRRTGRAGVFRGSTCFRPSRRTPGISSGSAAHRAAAGLTMESAKVGAFRQAVAGWADERLGPDDVRPRLRLDASVRFPDINAGLVAALSALAPFGAGNAKPLFCARNVSVADGPRRLKDRHLSLSLRQDGVALRGVFWRSAERAAEIEQARPRWTWRSPSSRIRSTERRGSRCRSQTCGRPDGATDETMAELAPGDRRRVRRRFRRGAVPLDSRIPDPGRQHPGAHAPRPYCGDGSQPWRAQEPRRHRLRSCNIEFDDILGYEDGRRKLIGVRALVPNRDGRDIRIKAKEAEVGPNDELLVMRGAIEFVSSDGLVGRTEEASFNQKEGVLRAPEHFDFRRNKLAGSSVGMAYDQNQDVMWLLANAALTLESAERDRGRHHHRLGHGQSRPSRSRGAIRDRLQAHQRYTRAGSDTATAFPDRRRRQGDLAGDARQLAHQRAGRRCGRGQTHASR